MKIAFLGCAETMPEAPGRRADAFEHDLQFGALNEGLSQTAAKAVAIDWRSPIEQFDGIDVALLGSAWDYTERCAEFCQRLEELESRGILVCNPSAVVRWNADKAYLRELEAAGIPTIPTLWVDDPHKQDIAEAFDRLNCDRVVVKRRIGAGGLGQVSFRRNKLPAEDWAMGQAAMIQPFQAAIGEEGELSFVFIDGVFSHAIVKRPASGDYRIQALYGGTEHPHRPALKDIKAAADAFDAIPYDRLLYARIDMVRGEDGHLRLIEAELIEPYLYPLQRRDFGKALARAVLARGVTV